MAVFVYCPRKSNGAMELCEALEAQRLRKFDGMDFWGKRKRISLTPGDTIINWGAHLPNLDGFKILNGVDRILNKYEEWTQMSRDGVPSPQMHPRSQIRDYNYALNHGYIPRKFHHVGGTDLLFPDKNPDFWVQKMTFTNEYRIHSFAGKSIRAGEKVVRDGFKLVESEKLWKPNANLAHPWIRSFDGGWRINYDNFKSNAKLRSIAAQAVKSLGLTFGAVDIGFNASNGQYTVLEVNMAPGIEGNSVGTYVAAIKKWMAGEAEETPKDEEVKAAQDPAAVPFPRRAGLRAPRPRRP